jgi:hypothetical protein
VILFLLVCLFFFSGYSTLNIVIFVKIMKKEPNSKKLTEKNPDSSGRFAFRTKSPRPVS